MKSNRPSYVEICADGERCKAETTLDQLLKLAGSQ
jgi:hypothetical protein